MPAGSQSAAQTAGWRKKDGRLEEERRDLGPCENVEKVITKDGKATSEKRWMCKFCDRTLQVPKSSWRTMGFMEAARRRMSSAARTPRQTSKQGWSKRCPTL
jgi:hypothetical protein